MRHYLYLLSSILILNFSANAQDTSATVSRYSFLIYSRLAVPYKGTESILKQGVNLAGSVLYDVSPSVKLGIEVSDQFNGGKSSFKSFNALSADFAVKWFPTALFDKVSKKVDERFLKNFYLGLGIGDSFNPLVRKGIGTINAAIGYNVPLKKGSAIDIKLMNQGFIFEDKVSVNGQDYSGLNFINFSVGYGFR